MKYYTIRIQQKSDGTEVRNISSQKTREEAEVQFHKVLAADMTATDITETLVSVMNSTGGIEMSRNWRVSTENIETSSEE